MLERFVVIAEKQKIQVLIVANKWNYRQAEAEAMFSPYNALGYKVVYSSAKEKIGSKSYEAIIEKNIRFAGCGVEKTPSIDALRPGWDWKYVRQESSTKADLHQGASIYSN
jgi:putative ribosome biogenesis GTPase RsgA